MTEIENNPLFAPAVLKLSFILKGIIDNPGFRFVYFGTLKKMDLTDTEVNVFIDKNREQLAEHIKNHGD